MRDHRDEYMDLDSDVGVAADYGARAPTASAVGIRGGAGPLGFAGTAHKRTRSRRRPG